jgi:hypothetical protein
MSRVWVIKEGAYYTNSSMPEICFKTKKAAEDECRKDGFKYKKSESLWLNGSYWRRIEAIKYVHK